MFSIHIKGQRDPSRIDMVKLSIIFYKSGCIRCSKVIYISGPYEEWDQRSESFRNPSPEYKAKNRLLQQERLKYLKVAEKWDAEKKTGLPMNSVITTMSRKSPGIVTPPYRK